MAEPGEPSSVVSQRVADVLAERILSGQLAAGARIKQDDLAAEFRTSRIPVREAIRILESRGLVVLRANAGAWVISMTLRDLELSYEIRERIEPLLLAESLPAITSDDVERMAAIQDEIEANDDVERFLALDREFHWTSYGRHQAPQLAAMVARLWDTTQAYRRAYVTLTGSQGSWVIDSEHRLLLDAIRRRDHDTAGAVLALHIRRTRTALSAHPDLMTGPT